MPNSFAELDYQRRRVVIEANPKSKSEKFPPPHEDAAVGYPLNTSHNGPVSFGASDSSFSSSVFDSNSSQSFQDNGTRRRKTKKEPTSKRPRSWKFIPPFIPSSISVAIDQRFKGKDPVSEVFGAQREKNV